MDAVKLRLTDTRDAIIKLQTELANKEKELQKVTAERKKVITIIRFPLII